MNKKQQELYEKLLKKVNEYCLGAAAEDVIEAIDNLVDEYEYPVDRSNTTKDVFKALQVIYNSQDIMGGYDDFWEAYRRIEYTLKAFELIKDKVLEPEYFELIASNCTITKEEYDLLKEILK